MAGRQSHLLESLRCVLGVDPIGIPLVPRQVEIETKSRDSTPRPRKPRKEGSEKEGGGKGPGTTFRGIVLTVEEGCEWRGKTELGLMVGSPW